MSESERIRLLTTIRNRALTTPVREWAMDRLVSVSGQVLENGAAFDLHPYIKPFLDIAANPYERETLRHAALDSVGYLVGDLARHIRSLQGKGFALTIQGLVQTFHKTAEGDAQAQILLDHLPNQHWLLEELLDIAQTEGENDLLILVRRTDR